MNNHNQKITSYLIPILYVSSMLVGIMSFPLRASANEWAGNERSGSCNIPNNRQTTFNCQYGPYRLPTRSGARQISGFYVNPRNQSGRGGTIPIEYRINGGGNWVRRSVVLNSTTANYINFGNGVLSFEFKFLRPNSEEGWDGTTTNFTFNYDLDR